MPSRRHANQTHILLLNPLLRTGPSIKPIGHPGDVVGGQAPAFHREAAHLLCQISLAGDPHVSWRRDTGIICFQRGNDGIRLLMRLGAKDAQAAHTGLPPGRESGFYLVIAGDHGHNVGGAELRRVMFLLKGKDVPQGRQGRGIGDE